MQKYFFFFHVAPVICKADTQLFLLQYNVSPDIIDSFFPTVIAIFYRGVFNFWLYFG